MVVQAVAMTTPVWWGGDTWSDPKVLIGVNRASVHSTPTPPRSPLLMQSAPLFSESSFKYFSSKTKNKTKKTPRCFYIQIGLILCFWFLILVKPLFSSLWGPNEYVHHFLYNCYSILDHSSIPARLLLTPSFYKSIKYIVTKPQVWIPEKKKEAELC